MDALTRASDVVPSKECARSLAMGNGGSSCNSPRAAVELAPSITPDVEPALLTAVAKESDCALAFSQSLRRLAGPGDIALRIGEVFAPSPTPVVLRSRVGGERVLQLPAGTPLPRIC